MLYGVNDWTELVGYSNSNWASDRDDRQSTTGYTFILSGGSIVWVAQKQCTVTLSSTEAEYMALTECLKHAQWTTSLLQQLLFDVELPIDIFCDSTRAQVITSNNVYHKRTKHIDIRYHYIHEKVADGMIVINEVNSDDNVADMLTKALS